VRVATFNILHGQRVLDRSQFGDTEPSALKEAVEMLNPDVLGMQEVDAHQARSAGVDQSLVAAEAMGAGADPARRRFVPAVHGTPGDRSTFTAAHDGHRLQADLGLVPDDGPMYGVALISRLPVADWHRTVFPPARLSLPLLVPDRPRPRFVMVPDEPRAVAAALVETDRGVITVATAHLSFVPGFNAWQLRQVRQWLDAMPRPLVLMGDFNLPGGIPERVTGWRSVVRGPTYPSFAPRVRFDHILVDGFSDEEVAAITESSQVWQLPVSDHCAVSADVPVTLG
jgi:endonuclease/exonuclease/phosphatase family metal-dependent hydrolase